MIIGNNKSHMIYANSVEETIYFAFILFLVISIFSNIIYICLFNLLP